MHMDTSDQREIIQYVGMAHSLRENSNNLVKDNPCMHACGGVTVAEDNPSSTRTLPPFTLLRGPLKIAQHAQMGAKSVRVSG